MKRLIVFFLLFAATAGTARAEEMFKTPSGNIGCTYDEAGGGRLICIIFQPKVVSAILTQDGVDASGPPETWTKDIVGPAVHVLDYGKTRQLGPFSCTSRKSGLTCSGKKHGFKMSRNAITTF